MDTGPKPRTPFWGLALFPGQSERAKPICQTISCPVKHATSVVWQKRGQQLARAHTHTHTWGQGFTDGRSGRWRDSSDVQCFNVWICAPIRANCKPVCAECTAICVFTSVSTGQRVRSPLLHWIDAISALSRWQTCMHSLLKPLLALCPHSRWHVGFSSSVLSSWSLSTRSLG